MPLFIMSALRCRSEGTKKVDTKEVKTTDSCTCDYCKNKYKNYCAEVRASMILYVSVSCEESVDKPNEPSKYGNSVEDCKANVAPRADRL